MERPRGEKRRVRLESFCLFLGPKSSHKGSPTRHQSAARAAGARTLGRRGLRAGTGWGVEAEAEAGPPGTPSPGAAASLAGRLEPEIWALGARPAPRARASCILRYVLRPTAYHRPPRVWFTGRPPGFPLNLCVCTGLKVTRAKCSSPSLSAQMGQRLLKKNQNL